MCVALGVSRYLKKELAWTTHKWLWVISNIQVELGHLGQAGLTQFIEYLGLA